jgi:Chlorophyllase enzyme
MTIEKNAEATPQLETLLMRQERNWSLIDPELSNLRIPCSSIFTCSPNNKTPTSFSNPLTSSSEPKVLGMSDFFGVSPIFDLGKRIQATVESGLKTQNLLEFCPDDCCKPRVLSHPKPFFKKTDRYTTTIATNGDPTDIYYPVVNSRTYPCEFPIALLLQGALVDKADYSNFAAQVASYGFIVVVPNHQRTLTAPTGQSVTGLFPEQRQVNDVLEQMAIEDSKPDSPIAKIIDTDKLGLLGHSFGGSVGLGASQTDICLPGICSEDFFQPPELMAGIFYGTSFRNPVTDAILPVNNQGIATGLIIGDRDGVVKPFSSEGTYDMILNPPKALITVEGANHYGITNLDNLIREPIRPLLDQSTATETISRWSALFLQAHLLGSKSAFDYIYNTGDALDPNVSVISQIQPTSSLASI